MNAALLLRYVGEIGFFAGMDVGERERLVQRAGYFRDFRPGEKILTEGEQSRGMFVLVRGRVLVTKNGHEAPLATLSPGAIFGEVAYLTEAPRTTTVTAEELVCVFHLDHDEFAALEEGMQVRIQEQIIRLLVGRLDGMNSALLRLARRVRDEAARGEAMAVVGDNKGFSHTRRAPPTPTPAPAEGQSGRFYQ